MKSKRTALLGQHRHYMNTNLNTHSCIPTIAHQVWVANMEMAISIAKVAKGNICTQETLRQLRTPLNLPTIQHTPITTTINVCNTSPNPPLIYHVPILTPRTCPCHASSTKSLYSKPCTNHHSLTPPHHITLFPILLRHNNTSKTKPPHHYSHCFTRN
jgi:hypothetical protein